jgi:GWxTD domain-containing protein
VQILSGSIAMNFRGMKFRLVPAFFITAFLLSGCSSSNQTETTDYRCYYDYVNAKSSMPEFYTKLFWSPDSSGARLDVYISVRESRLRFDKDSSLFVGSYSCTIHMSGTVPLSKEVDRKVVLAAYPKPGENSYDAFLTSFPIGSGKHTVEVVVNDNESRVKSSKFYSIDIPEISNKPLVLSSVMFLARYDTSGESTKITPFILSNVGILSDTLNFFTVLSSKAASDDSVFFHVYRLRGKEPGLPTFNAQMWTYRRTLVDPCGYDLDTILVYKQSVVQTLKEGISLVFGSVPKPPPGNFLLKIIVKNDSNEYAGTSLSFQIHDRSFPDVSGNIAEMVSSLNFIAAPNEIKKIIDGKTDSLIKENLVAFWKDHGGLAKMVQYYQRVAQANQFFTSCIDGWRTPMGMYYVVCGAPDNVECEGEWDEKWTYYQGSSQTGMTVVFRLAKETTNIGDRFYGIEQVYSNVDLWSYYVNQWRTPY